MRLEDNELPVRMAARPRPGDGDAPTEGSPRGSHWWALLVVSAAQLLVVLDGTIVNIALPSAQAALGMSDGDRHWAITAYALAFGGLLLIGGRLSGAVGHRRMFVIGLAGFALASAVGGAAVDPGMLFVARALQGVFAAGLAPAGLSLLTRTFTAERERARAFGVFAAVGATGSAVGLILGGSLTEYADWRWCLYINVPIAILALLGCTRLPTDQPLGASGGFDIAGALLSLGGFAAVVYAFGRAEALGWASPTVLALLGLGVLLLALFVVVERRTAEPLLPMRILLHRARAAAFCSIALMYVAMFGFYLFMSYYTQTILGFPPIRAGMTLLINALAAVVGSMLIAGRLQGRLAPVALIVPGLLAAAAGMVLLTRLSAHSTDVFLLFLVPALTLTGLGLGCIMPSAASLATAGTQHHDTGAASAAYNASQQIGAALGTALLNSVAASSAAALTARSNRIGQVEASIHGYTSALTVGFGVLLGAVLIVLLLTVGRPTRTGDGRRSRSRSRSRSWPRPRPVRYRRG